MTRLSVIVPTRGPGERLGIMLRSLNESVPPSGEVEVLLVVDGPGDVTPHLEGLSLDVRVLATGGGRGAAYARNRGAEAARADVLAFLDDDVVVSAGWCADVLATLDDDWDLLGGRLGSVRPRNLVSQMFETLVIRHGRVGERWFLASANLLVRASAYRSLGGFDERYPGAGGEDWDLCRRAHRDGLRVRVAERCVVHHWNPTRIRSLTSRAAAYAASSPLRFAADRPRFDDEDRIVGVAIGNGGRMVDLVREVLPGAAVAIRQRYREVREHGVGPLRSVLVLAIHLPWFLRYSVLSLRALRRADARGGSA